MKQQLKDIIELIEQNTDQSAAHIRIVTDEYSAETSITGNVEGLRLMAINLLKESIALEEGFIVNEDISSVPWNLTENNSFKITGVATTRNEAVNELSIENMPDAENPGSQIGCYLILIALIALLVMGIVFLVKLF
jgi:hypothetical protein